MGNVDGRGVPLPADEHSWENWIHHLLVRKHRTQANAYGRHGQKQHGIDFVVTDQGDRIGVQCKFVAQGSKLNVKKVAEDIESSFAIRPALKRFALYSSASSDPKTADALDELKGRSQEKGLKFEWLLWRDFEEDVRTYNLFDRLRGPESLIPVPDADPNTLQALARPSQDNSGISQQVAAPIRTAASTLSSQMLDAVKVLLENRNSAGAMALVDALLGRPENVPSAELAKAYSTKAILTGRSGNFREAAPFWRKAADVEPDPNLKHGRRAQAFLSEDRYQDALDAALPGLAVDPPSSLSAVAALIAAQHLGRRTDIEALIPDRLKIERDIGLVRAHVAMADGDLAAANDLVAAVAQEHPDDADALALRADLLLQKALGGPQRFRSEVVTGGELRDLENSVPLYRQSLEARDPVRERATWLPAAMNFMSVLKLLNQHEEAAELGMRIIAALGTSVDDLGRILLTLAEGGKEVQALEIANTIDRKDVKCSIAKCSALLALKRYSEAKSLGEQTLAIASGQDADNIAWMLFVATMRAEPDSNLAQEAKRFYERCNSKMSACARLIENAPHLGFPEIANDYAERAIDFYRLEPSLDRVPLVVDAMMLVEKYPDAVEVLLKHVDIDHPQGGPIEERLAYCLLRQYRHETLGKLLGGLPKDAKDAARFDPYRIDYALARGDRPAALLAVQEALPRRVGDLKLHALEIHLLRELKRVDEARSLLKRADFQANANRQAIKMFVSEARALGEDELASDFSYRWIRANDGDPEGVAWFLGDFLLGRIERALPKSLSEAGSRTGLLLKALDARKPPRCIVIDDRFEPDVTAGWFAPNSHGIEAFLGKKVGDVVPFIGFPGGPFTIERIVPPYEGAFFLLQGRYGRDVPMVDGLQYMSLQGEGDDLDMAPIFNMLDANKRASESALSAYAENPIPLGVIARGMNRNPIDLWGGLVGTENQVRAMSADLQSAEAFQKRMEGVLPDVVLDPVTLIGWRALGLTETAVKSVGKMFMTESALSIIRHKRSEMDIGGEQPRMVLGAGDKAGTYVRTEVSGASVAASCEFYDDTLSWIERHVTVLPVPASGLQEDIYSAMRSNWPPYLADSMQLAASLGNVLVADDLGLELISRSAGVPQVPTAAAMRAAAGANRITSAEFAHALREFAQANYEFVSFNADDLWALTDLDSYSATPDVAVLLRYLRAKSLNVPSGFTVVGDYMIRLAGANVATHHLTGCLTVSLSALTRHGTRYTAEIFRAFVNFSKLLPRKYGQAALDALSAWMQGHFLALDDLFPKSPDVPQTK